MTYTISKEEYNKLSAFEKQLLWETVSIGKALIVIIKHLEIINKKHLKKVKGD